MRIEVILLEKGRYGDVGDIVSVAGGFARNYLFPRQKALRSTPENKKVFEARRALIEAEHLRKVIAAREMKNIIEEVGAIEIARQSSEDGKLYGSITTKDIAVALSKVANSTISAELIRLHDKIKAIGVYNAEVALYSDVAASIAVKVVRT